MQQEVVLLPTVTVGFSPHHLCFPGTLSLCAETYMHLVRDTCRSILSAGFRRIYILNAHGGNAPAHEMVLRELKVEFPTAVLADPEYYYLAAGTISEVAEGHQLGHGDEIETSLMLHVAPELVQMHAAVADGLEPVIPVHALVTNANEKSIHGNDGNPLNASADLGRELHSRITDVLVADIRAFAGTITMLGRSGFK
jgi:creatinine amidohydrolase